MRLGLWSGAVVALVLLIFQQGAVVSSDGATMLAVSHSLVHHGSVAVPAGTGSAIPGRDGAHYSPFGIGMSLLAIPSVALATVLGWFVSHDAALESFLSASLEPLLLGALVVALVLLGRRLGAERRWAVVVAIGSGLGTYAIAYGKDFFSEPLAALGILIMLERIMARRFVWASLGLAIAMLARPQELVLAPICVAAVLVWIGPKPAARFTLAPAGALVLTLLYDIARFGRPLDLGYRAQDFSTPFLHGIAGNLVSPSKSILLFAPVIVLIPWGLAAAWRKSSLVVTLLSVNFLVTLVLAATYLNWNGGWAWGPRLLLPAVMPFLAVLCLLPGRLRAATVLLFVLGFAVSASVLLVPTRAQQLDSPTPTAPAVLRQYQLLPRVSRYTVHNTLTHPGLSNPGAHREFLGLWQVELTRQLGHAGLAFAVMGSIVLLFALAFVAQLAVRPTLRRQLPASDPVLT